MHVIAQLNYDYQFLCNVKWKKAKRKLALGVAEIVNVSENGKILAIRLLKYIRRTFGAAVKYSKRKVHIRDGFTCQYCGAHGTTIDHVIPKSRGGKSDCFQNTVSCCKKCNEKKSNRLPSEAHMYLKRQPYQPTIMEFIMKMGECYSYKN